MHVYEIRPHADRRGFDLISDVLPFGGMGMASGTQSATAIGYVKFYSQSHDAE